MVANTMDSAANLEDLSPVEIYGFATVANRGKYKDPARRHKSLVAAKVSAAQTPGVVKIYEFNFDTEEWVEVK